jgi:hypothetical protein
MDKLGVWNSMKLARHPATNNRVREAQQAGRHSSFTSNDFQFLGKEKKKGRSN